MQCEHSSGDTMGTGVEKPGENSSILEKQGTPPRYGHSPQRNKDHTGHERE